VTPVDWPAPVALAGSGEFTRAAESADLALLQGRPRRVVFLPTAAGTEGDARIAYWLDKGTRHYAGLGAEPVPLRVVTREDAEDDSLAARVAGAGLVYLSGGVPSYLVETLAGTRVWQAIVDAWRAGAALAGCSAGAMALCTLTLDPRGGGTPRPGLGVVPHAAILPHFDRFDRLRPQLAESVRPLLPGGVHLVGIDEDTTLVGGPEEWTVHGRQGAWVIGADGQRHGATSGEPFRLPLA
jgi:cyanophycinase